MGTATELGVGIIGHQFMGKAHSQAWLDVASFFPELGVRPAMRVMCGIGDDVPQMAARWGWEHSTQDYHEVLARDNVHIVDICTPNNLHAQMAADAARAGKHILCEKPLALDTAQALDALRAVQDAGVKAQVAFCYRRCPAAMLARHLVRGGELGRIFHVRAHYLQSWGTDPQRPLAWRMTREVAGSGAHGDLNAHIIDLARHITGLEFLEVCAAAETFVPQRPLPDGSGERGEVTVDDALLFLARLEGGALASFQASRFAQGHKNDAFIEVGGEHGSVAFAFERMNELRYFDARRPKAVQGWTTILATEPSAHPYVAAYWPPGHVIGYEHQFISQARDLLEAVAADRPPWPDFVDGLRCQEVLDAALQSADTRAWVEVERHDV
ncbi:MAG: Gfo/Idh/MocA family protein [bacterium]